MTVEEKIHLLNIFSRIAPENAAAEDEDENLISYFLPLRSYSKLADEKVFLITGGRGAGKSELFRVLTSGGGLKHVLSESDKKRYTRLEQSEFIVGYQSSGPNSKIFPTQNVLGRYAEKQDEEIITCLWGGLLCAVLLREYMGDKTFAELAERWLDSEQIESLRNHSSMPETWMDWMCCNLERWEHFLDQCDDYLAGQNIRVFIVYDELDRVCPQYKDLFLYIRSLLGFWFLHNNRWQNLKAKIFLRRDLYIAKALHFVDSSKMRAYHLELQWDSLSLYRLLIKRLANSGDEEMVAYLKSVRGLLARDKQDALGYLPTDEEDRFKEFVEILIGKYMGSTPKRGFSYSWIPNHIQDAKGEVAPRPFLKCFVFASAELCNHMDEVRKLADDRLISPTRLQGALASVSRDRVDELILEEYGWMDVLRRKLGGQSMLMERSAFLKYLATENWDKSERGMLPGNSPEELLEALESLGIVSETGDGRINTPEIYLHGFGLKRRGGIKRPRG